MYGTNDSLFSLCVCVCVCVVVWWLGGAAGPAAGVGNGAARRLAAGLPLYLAQPARFTTSATAPFAKQRHMHCCGFPPYHHAYPTSICQRDPYAEGSHDRGEAKPE